MPDSNDVVPLDFVRLSPEAQSERLDQFDETMRNRRSVREFSNHTFDEAILHEVIRTAGRAPSGANQQPWTFVVVRDLETRRTLKQAAEAEEQERARQAGLSPGARPAVPGDKPYLVDAPYLVALFRQNCGLAVDEDGKEQKVTHYYPHESVAIAAGFFLAAARHAGLDVLTHAPVQASRCILGRPENESPFLLFAVGHAPDGYRALGLHRRSVAELVSGNIRLDKFCIPKVAPEYRPLAIRDDVERLRRAIGYFERMKTRRNVRDFSSEPVDMDLIAAALGTALGAPSAGNLQPIRFAVVRDTETKRRIRAQAEEQEKRFYEERIPDAWRKALRPLGTNWEKEHITAAPLLIVASYALDDPLSAPIVDGGVLQKRVPTAMTSAGIAVGFLMNALHHAGLCTLTYTPSPMGFLRDLLGRPRTELPLVVMPVGYPAPGCTVPAIPKKPLDDIMVVV